MSITMPWVKALQSCPFTACIVRHVQSMHKQLKPINCEHCDFATSTKDRLDQHNEHYHKITFKCDNCDFSSPQKCHINEHVLIIHRKKEPFQCKHCDYAVMRKARLVRHVNSIHKEPCNFTCIKCDFEFVVLKHICLKHNCAQDKKKIVQNYKCKFCDFKTMQMSTLTQHLDKAHKMKPQASLQWLLPLQHRKKKKKNKYRYEIL